MAYDYISRQAAIDTVVKSMIDGADADLVEGLLELLPAADVQPVRRGKWILSEDRYWKTCSECGADVDVSMGLGIFVDNDEVSEMCFCPNCGARMDGESDEQS